MESNYVWHSIKPKMSKLNLMFAFDRNVHVLFCQRYALLVFDPNYQLLFDDIWQMMGFNLNAQLLFVNINPDFLFDIDLFGLNNSIHSHFAVDFIPVNNVIFL
jgi:hypothetical protein